MQKIFDVAVLGAGAAGLMCAGLLKDKSVVIIEGNKKPGLKVLASGGGLCNFSNKNISKNNYHGQNAMFCLSALAGYKNTDFTDILNKKRIPFNIRPDGKMFALSSKSILDTLLAQIDGATTVFALETFIKSVAKKDDIFEIETNKKTFYAKNVVCALGGISYPALGAKDSAYKIAKSFGINVTGLYPALTGIIFDKPLKDKFSPLAGISCKAELKCGKIKFNDDMLFTHEGISGPAVFQLSLYGLIGKEVVINFLPGFNLEEFIFQNKNSAKKMSALLSGKLPARLIEELLGRNDKQLASLNKKEIQQIVQYFCAFTFIVKEVNGYNKAEITAGGADTKGFSSKTMEAVNTKGLYFIGEALDISGQLGGYNLHWAWASAAAAAKSLNDTERK